MIDKQALSTPRQIGVMPVIVLDTLGTTGLIWGAQTACAPTRVHRQTMITLGTICPGQGTKQGWLYDEQQQTLLGYDCSPVAFPG